jgi:hypothetical protein
VYVANREHRSVGREFICNANLIQECEVHYKVDFNQYSGDKCKIFYFRYAYHGLLVRASEAGIFMAGSLSIRCCI